MIRDIILQACRLPGGILDERRREQRKHISYYLRIFDHDSGELIGHLIDFSNDGLRVLTEEPVETGMDFKLRLDLAAVMNFEQQLLFDAKSVWLEQDYSSNSYNCGFVIVKISNKTREIIEQLIAQLAG